MRFRLPLKRDEVPVAEVRHRSSDVEDHHGDLQVSKEATTKGAVPVDDSSSNLVNTDFQHGVQTAQAMTQAWSKQHLIIAYIL